MRLQLQNDFLTWFQQRLNISCVSINIFLNTLWSISIDGKGKIQRHFKDTSSMSFLNDEKFCKKKVSCWLEVVLHSTGDEKPFPTYQNFTLMPDQPFLLWDKTRNSSLLIAPHLPHINTWNKQKCHISIVFSPKTPKNRIRSGWTRALDLVYAFSLANFLNNNLQHIWVETKLL